ncbi:MAG: ABC transporter ATP-binding protein [Paracoccaceae bacterium]|jgi:peptide/nickel transport system ATP-binding protein|nr:MAG: peptide ABC transporter ATP-binding protein [Rhodobacter sp. BACL10 MAG-120910-bin24]KRP22805.1 MAG: peptide ABC transporter ATP-binding protein [Rhodobacter sp. BACL10 MAG-120419-bin15]MDA0355754.1 ABC transporter ATP-binding protein [Pseudomonadota bacterium]MDP5322595.1 ABC transporter ATP-binding protein [Paracoccaceae bacterium]HAG26224.1 peptide ABC transporter ATP-binding protein [Rhodobacter sp.]|tara:strand:+ start:3698 stop:4531 length:834 start_codon:yes stop_codon:yes gene_type:complete
MTPFLSVENLNISFPARQKTVQAVRGVNFSMGRERLGIVGESGSGKSQTGRAILGLTPSPGVASADRLEFDGTDLTRASQSEWRAIRGQRISMVMQDPKFSLNPVMTIGWQLIEAYRTKHRAPKSLAVEKSLEMLNAVQIRDVERVMRAYPHELSGGMGQRAMIAMMLITEPELLIADEPTSALDVTVQIEVLRILDKLVTDRGMGLIFISHDLRLVSSFCDRVLVMYAGQIVEEIAAADLAHAKHPYTQGLFNCLPRIEGGIRPLPILTRDDAWAN